jgi:hypothetical protein
VLNAKPQQLATFSGEGCVLGPPSSYECPYPIGLTRARIMGTSKYTIPRVNLGMDTYRAEI